MKLHPFYTMRHALNAWLFIMFFITFPIWIFVYLYQVKKFNKKSEADLHKRNYKYLSDRMEMLQKDKNESN